MVCREEDFFGVFRAVRIVGLEQVLNPSRVFHHDGQGVVYLVGDAGREFADGGQLAGLHEVPLHPLLFAFGLEQTLLGPSGQGQGRGDDSGAAHEDNAHGQQPGLHEWPRGQGLGLMDDQDAAR